MKKVITIAVACSMAVFGISATEKCLLPNDTIINIDGKRIEMTDNGEKVKVKIYDMTDNDSVPYEQIFEGQYRNGQSKESRKYFKIEIPNPMWRHRRNHFHTHWAGFGIGYNKFTDRGDNEKVPINTGNSLEFNLNLLKGAVFFSKYRWALVYGVGFRWNRFSLKGNYHFEDVNDCTQIVPAAEGRTYKRSKLNITYLTVPLLLEWQNHNGRYFVSGGVVGAFRTASSSKIKYKDESGKTHKEKIDEGLTLRPITMDFILQAGFRKLGVYAKYSPISLFEKNKGPELYPISMGIMLFW